MIEIKSRYDGAVIYRSETATTIKEAVEEAVRNDANLNGAILRGAWLEGANLRGAKIADGVVLSDDDCKMPLHLKSVGKLGKYWLHVFGPYAKIGCHVKAIEEWLEYKSTSLSESEMHPYKSFLKSVLEYRRTK